MDDITLSHHYPANATAIEIILSLQNCLDILRILAAVDITHLPPYHKELYETLKQGLEETVELWDTRTSNMYMFMMNLKERKIQ